MPLQETFARVNGQFVPGGLLDGKVVPGLTWLRDPQTFEFEPVLAVHCDVPSSDYTKCGARDVNAMNGGGRIHGSQGRA